MNGGSGASETARAVREGSLSAVSAVERTLDAIAKSNPRLNAFSLVYAEEALIEGARVDAAVAQGRNPGRLAGVPFAVKSLFDVEGQPTVAGAAARSDCPPAKADAFLIAQLKRQGAILVGATHMDELACGATGENPHFGAVHNPHDCSRITGGSSGGSAAAVAAGMVPLALGTDTNGSIRAPAALCGIWGVKPTFGRLSRQGALPYANSLDCMGGFADNVRDLALLYDCLQGVDALDAQQVRDPVDSIGLVASGRDLRVGVLTGYFERYANEESWNGVELVARMFSGCSAVPITLEEMQLVRCAAVIISNVEVAAAHEELLATNGDKLSAHLKTRLLAGALAPAKWYLRAREYQRAYRARMETLLAQYDVLLAPCTPFPAPPFGTKSLLVKGESLEPAKHLGMLTQPISFAGLPVVTAPIFIDGNLPVGVQLIGAPWREDCCFHAAHQIEQALRQNSSIPKRPHQPPHFNGAQRFS